MAPARRSGRVKGPRAVYAEDPFQKAGISDEEDSGEVDTAPGDKDGRRRGNESASDAEFVAGSDAEDPTQEATDASEDEEDEVEVEVEDENGDDDAMEIDERRKTFKLAKKTPQTSRARYLRQRRADGVVELSADETRYRGILDPKDHVSKQMHYLLTFGSDDRDLKATIFTRGRWRFARDIALPSRFTLDLNPQDPDGYGTTFGVHLDDLARESSTAWDWYYDEKIGKSFRERQRLDRNLREDEARSRYLPRPRKEKHTVIMGPIDNQQTFRLGYNEPIDFSEAWGETTGPKSNQRAGSKAREGWLINFDQRILAMAWAPNQDGASQYLAVAAPITDDEKKKYDTSENTPYSAFHPTPSYPTALQIWEFKGQPAGARINTMDMTTKPQLRQVLCSDWGDLRRISWCQAPREWRDSDSEDQSESLGLLAGVWGDGKVRVLDIKLRRDSKSTEFIKLDSPVFEAKPPSTVCACVTWLSPSDLLVGCSNGFVAIWSIQTTSTEPRPWFYYPIHTTYVLNINSLYPVHPHLVATISMDGETRMWSIIDPQSENTSTVRMRSASSHLSYSPVLQAVCSSDENEFGRLMPVRRFFATNSIGKMPSPVSALAPCSWWHPSILFGGTGGEVVATNPFRRLLSSKEGQWQQPWFTHEWIQGPDANGTGISRFIDGYRADTQNLARNVVGEHRPMGLSLTTIQEEGTHVTGLGWNPNRRCAGWASGTLGCGLLRVEDLAL